MTQLTSTSDAPRALCPVSALADGYRPFEHAGMYEFFAKARAEEPVFFSREINYWVVTRREDVLAILRDPARFSAAITLAPVKPLPPSVLAQLKAQGYAAEATQVSSDPPKHTRIRESASALLNPRQFRAIEPRVAEVIGKACDALEGRARADLVATSHTSCRRA